MISVDRGVLKNFPSQFDRGLGVAGGCAGAEPFGCVGAAGGACGLPLSASAMAACRGSVAARKQTMASVAVAQSRRGPNRGTIASSHGPKSQSQPPARDLRQRRTEICCLPARRPSRRRAGSCRRTSGTGRGALVGRRSSRCTAGQRCTAGTAAPAPGRTCRRGGGERRGSPRRAAPRCRARGGSAPGRCDRGAPPRRACCWRASTAQTRRARPRRAPCGRTRARTRLGCVSRAIAVLLDGPPAAVPAEYQYLGRGGS